MCSSSWLISGGIGRWCGWRTGSRGCRRGRSPGGCRRVSGLYAYLVARGDTPVQVNPVPRGLMTRRQGGTMRSRMAPLVRVPRTLPRILSPEEADRLVGALRTHRDQAMLLAMLLAGVRRCEEPDYAAAERAIAAAADAGIDADA